MAKGLKQAIQQLRAEQRVLAARLATDRRLEQDVRRKAKEQAAAERVQARAAAAMAERNSRRRARTSYEAWLDERDARVPLTRADLHSQHDRTAAGVVEEGAASRL